LPSPGLCPSPAGYAKFVARLIVIAVAVFSRSPEYE
jgi:hypothetical protein